MPLYAPVSQPSHTLLPGVLTPILQTQYFAFL